jgi:hypothetical protein
MARLRVKDQEDVTCLIEHVTYEHNHYLLQSLSILVFLHSHKNFDSSLLQYVKDLQFQSVPITLYCLSFMDLLEVDSI